MVDKPWEGWELQLKLEAASRSGDVVFRRIRTDRAAGRGGSRQRAGADLLLRPRGTREGQDEQECEERYAHGRYPFQLRVTVRVYDPVSPRS